MAKKKAKLESAIKVRLYPILSRAVESGIEYGWNRAHKHVDDPSEDAIKNEIYESVMNDLCELFIFPEDS